MTPPHLPTHSPISLRPLRFNRDLIGHAFSRLLTPSHAFSRLLTPSTEISSVITPRATQVLTTANHSGRQFNFAMGRVLGSWALPPPPRASRFGFTKFTVPALEVRRMLAEARAAGQAFQIEYTILDGMLAALLSSSPHSPPLTSSPLSSLSSSLLLSLYHLSSALSSALQRYGRRRDVAS